MTTEKMVFTLAFKTAARLNRLTQSKQVQLVEKLTAAFGGATLTEHLGGYVADNGRHDIEYSYTIELIGVRRAAALKAARALASDNSQESFIFNGALVYTSKK